MKKFLSLFIFSLTLVYQSLACSWLPDSFCRSCFVNEDDHVFMGQILAIDDDGIDFLIIDKLRGDETRDTVRIWDGSDFDCNGIFSMAAADLGEPGDSILIVLPKIEEIDNPWDVLGDYRRPSYMPYTPRLLITNGRLSGLIKGMAGAPDEYLALDMEYQDFKVHWQEGDDCSAVPVNISKTNSGEFMLYPNPVDNNLVLAFDQRKVKKEVSLFSIQGQRLKFESTSSQSITMDTSDLANGIYLLRIIEDGIGRPLIKISVYHK